MPLRIRSQRPPSQPVTRRVARFGPCVTDRQTPIPCILGLKSTESTDCAILLPPVCAASPIRLRLFTLQNINDPAYSIGFRRNHATHANAHRISAGVSLS